VELSGIGEMGLIRLLGRDAPRYAGVRVGIGDDTAVVRAQAGRDLLLTCDLMAEGVHFQREWYSGCPELLGRKALAVNVSDIAGMGGRPLYCLVTLGVPPGLELDFIRRVYAGLYDLARECGVSVVGGDTVGFDGGMLLDVFLAGDVAAGGALLRSGARPGDLIVVTGDFGLARAGLELLKGGPPSWSQDLQEGYAAAAVTRLLAPPVRLREASALAGTGLVHALSDTSDGLAAQVSLICEASGAGAVVDGALVPARPETRAVAGLAGASACDWALYGGEDYELIGAVRAEHVDLVRAAMPRDAAPLAVVGGFTSDPAVMLRTPGGGLEPLGKAEYRHF